ncbi:MAG TPA: hypothetical protein VEI94_16120 [Candidatus Bathyarchaeia archaeon]|nr:hypothetical protein [Candidatus Bathyarchaeia archaeon]
MRMILPPIRERRAIDRLLSEFFEGCEQRLFRRAMNQLSRYYRLPVPKVVWYEYLDWGKTAGRTYENGEIHLVHPENWKRGRKYNSKRRWINTIFHEMGHYIFWTDAERKADTFAYRMVRGLIASRPSSVDRVDRIDRIDRIDRSMRRLATGGGTRTSDRVGQLAVAARRRTVTRSRTAKRRKSVKSG